MAYGRQPTFQGPQVGSFRSQGVGAAAGMVDLAGTFQAQRKNCLLYTSPSPRDRTRSRMPSSA